MSEHPIEDIVPLNMAPSADRLEGLTPGCYVKVNDGGKRHWVELTDVDGNRCSGQIQQEANTCCAQTEQSANNTIDFDKSQIVDLGCDRYCFC